MNNQQINRKAKYAWAQYFRAIREAHEEMRDIVVNVREVTKTELPTHAINTMKSMIDKYKHHVECVICTDEFTNSTDVEILIGCGHMFCKPCVAQYRDTNANPKCPICRKRM
jgi:hypothetical protein